MGGAQNALIFLVDAILTLYALVILLRFLLQVVRADFYNPLSQFVVRATNPVLKPLRRIIPGVGGVDVAALVLLYLFALLTVTILLLIAGIALNPATIAIAALVKCVTWVINLYFFTIIIQVILSWVSQGGYHPVAGALMAINAPLLRPFRRAIPPMGGFDLSPLFVLLLLQAANILLQGTGLVI
ncbi:MAG: YggT family protein [Gammaproteobacteria bacterium]|nr:YggT family protein [Gammaproteobacteria bacterium]